MVLARRELNRWAKRDEAPRPARCSRNKHRPHARLEVSVDSKADLPKEADPDSGPQPVFAILRAGITALVVSMVM